MVGKSLCQKILFTLSYFTVDLLFIFFTLVNPQVFFLMIVFFLGQVKKQMI
jgi:hypothetical protein